MNGCDDLSYAVTLTVAHVYEIRAVSEEEALKEALKLRSEGVPGRATWPAGYDISATEPQGHRATEKEDNGVKDRNQQGIEGGDGRRQLSRVVREG